MEYNKTWLKRNNLCRINLTDYCSFQVAYHLCDYIAKGQKEMLVSNRLRSIADVVLERVAEILG